jgi:hypothetical protein
MVSPCLQAEEAEEAGVECRQENGGEEIQCLQVEDTVEEVAVAEDGEVLQGGLW